MRFQIAIGEVQDNSTIRNVNEFFGRRLPSTRLARLLQMKFV